MTEINETLDTQVLQRMLDEQGYIVVGWHSPAVKGQVFDELRVYDKSPEGPGNVAALTVVIGTAEASELVAQARKYYPHKASDFSVWPHHFKVAAE